MPPRMQPHLQLRKLRLLRRREEFVDLLIGELELSADFRLESAEDRLDLLVMGVNDRRDLIVLLRR